jgi:DNA replication protein DnaC
LKSFEIRGSDSSGVGKTRLAIALGYLATQQGYKTRFFSAPSGVDAGSGSALRPLPPAMHRAVNAYKLPIIDEMGYLPMSREQANLGRRAAGCSSCVQ